MRKVLLYRIGHSPMCFIGGYDEENLGCKRLKLELL